jgi:transposase-like protein
MSKSDKIREHFRKNPDTRVADVAKKFDASAPMVYKLRSQVQKEKLPWWVPEPVVEAITEEDLDLQAITMEPSDVDRTLAERAKSALEVQVAGDHYRRMKIQPVEYIHKNGIPFIEGCIIKYASRWRDKGGIKDLEKIKHFADLLIELEGVGR